MSSLAEGVALYNSGDYKRAMVVLERAVKERPTPEGFYHLALNYEALELVTKAEAGYTAGLEIDPNNAPCLNNRANIRHALGNWDGALEDHQKALEVEPDNPDFHSNLGDCLRRMVRIDEALAAHGRALELDPNNGWSNYNLGNMLVVLDRIEEAKPLLDKAITYTPDLDIAYGCRASLYDREGRVDLAKADLAAYFKHSGRDPGEPAADPNEYSQEEFIILCLERLSIKNERATHWGFGTFKYYDTDMEKQSLVLIRHDDSTVNCSAQVAGSFDMMSQSFLWGWANTYIPRDVIKHAEKTKAFVEKKGYRKLAIGDRVVDVRECMEMLAVTIEVNDDEFGYVAGTGKGWVYFSCSRTDP